MSTTTTALAVQQPELSQLALQREVDFSTWNALKEIYDGASDEKVALVLDYCKARKMDPLKKPVHIVQVWSSRRRCMVESIWPSITELRITAMRTGVYAGRDETKFGPTITQELGTLKTFQYPEWAQVTVYRIVGCQRCAFPGPRVYFIEAYAKKKRDDYTPNEMWERRTWGQLDKCAEGAALRMAFPEETGGQPTGDEMAGREVDTDGMQVVTEAAGAEGAVAGTEPEKKRAAVPKKKGAAAMPTGPVVEAETAPAKPAEPVASEPAPTAPPATEPPSAPSATPAAPAAGQPTPTDPAPGATEKPEWPKVVRATVDECVEARVSNNPKYDRVKVAVLGSGKCMLNGQEIDVVQLGKVVFDPEHEELRPFAKVSDEVLELTLEQRPSASNPAKKNILIIKAVVADVDL